MQALQVQVVLHPPMVLMYLAEAMEALEEMIMREEAHPVVLLPEVLQTGLRAHPSGLLQMQELPQQAVDKQESRVELAIGAGDGKNDQTIIKVRDNGCGMDEETLQRATTPFFSAKPAGRQRGMGLAYAARVIQVNQGRLVLQSRLDQGTEVLISLPRGEPS